MVTAGHPAHGLDHEIHELVISTSCGRKANLLTLPALFAFLGGYRGPAWAIDRRPQPLRGRRTAPRVRTLLRRRAVTRLRIEGHSFRRIGRELGISQVAAWKLWRQVLMDVIEVGQAERAGLVRLAGAMRQQDTGDDLAVLLLLEEVNFGFGSRATATFLKAQGQALLSAVSQHG